jgi:transcription elongation factor Elf1
LDTNTTSQYTKQNIPYSLLYDENGIKHNWDIYCYEDEELTIDQLLKKDSWNDPILDVKCSICNIKKSETGKLDNKKIEKSLRAIAEFDVFFIFYQSRCPEGKLHEWGGHICKKCGLDVKFITNRDAQSKDYYKKYYDIFKTSANSAKYTFEKIIVGDNSKKEKSTNISNVDFSWVVKLSKLFSIDSAIIESIGCTQYLDFEEIKMGNKNIAPIESILDDRIYAANAEIRYLFTMYSLLNNGGEKNNDIINILEKINFPKYEYKNLQKYLPKIDAAEYNKNYDIIQKTFLPEDIFKFTINHLAYYICNIANYEPKESSAADEVYTLIKPLCMEFAKFIITRIINNQKLLSKPVNFTWKYFTEVEDDYINDSEQIGDIGEDDDPPDEDDMIYSGENIDYDIDGDNEEDNNAGIDF